MIKLVLFNISLFLSLLGNSQSFNDLLFSSDYSTYLSDIIEQDSFFIITGMQQDTFSIWYIPNTKSREIYIKVNKVGVILDTLVFDTVGYNDMIRFTIKKDSFYYSIGYTQPYNDTNHISVIKRDANFNFISKYIHPGGIVNSNVMSINTTYSLNDSLLFLTGNYYSYQGYYGTKPFVASFNLNTMQMERFASLLPDYIPVNMQYDTISQTYSVFDFNGMVYLYDSSFNLQSVDTLVIHAPASTFPLDNKISYLKNNDSLTIFCGRNVSFFYSNYPNGIYSLASLAVLVVDTDFNEVNHFFWYHDSIGQIFPSEHHCIIRSTDNGYFMGGYSATAGGFPLGVFVVKADSNFNTVWQKHIDTDSMPYVSDMIATEDGGVLVLYTYVDTEVGPTKFSAKLIKIGPNGEVTTIYEFKNPMRNSIVSLYPNPASKQITLASQQAKQSIISYTLYDIQGKVLQSKQLNSHQIQIDIEQLSKGAYIIQGRTTDGIKFSQKFIKE